MTKYQSIDTVSSKLLSADRINSISQDLKIPSHVCNQNDIQMILELLNTANDINVQIKLLLVLSTCTMSDYANLNVIIKSRAVYDGINNVLKTGLPQKAVYALNFISLLLHIEVEDDTSTRRKLVQYAKNMTRISGCLDTMANLFSNRMMYLDTWKALCQSLAAACSDCETNQSYCTDLIPVCIQKCSSTNMDVFFVLQNLLRNHHTNMQRFLDCNGLEIFTRELLQYDKCLQLLRTAVVQYPDMPQLLVRQTEVVNNLREFLRLNGPASQTGQKALIILHHIESRAGDPDLKSYSNNAEKNISDRSLIMQSVENYKNIQECQKNEEMDNTATLMQNIMKEVFMFKKNAPLENATPTADVNSLLRDILMLNNTGEHRNNMELGNTQNILNATKKLTEHQRKVIPQSNIRKEPSFSFLENNDNQQRKHIRCSNAKEPSFSFMGNKTNQQGQNRPQLNIAKEPSFSFLENNNQQRKDIRIQCNMVKEPLFSYMDNQNSQLQQDKRQCNISNEATFTILENNNQQQKDITQSNAKEPYSSFMDNHKNQQLKCEPQYNIAKEPSFSFLENHNYKLGNNSLGTRNKKETSKIERFMAAEKDLQDVYESNSKQNCTYSCLDFDEFKPIFTSTPKHEYSSRKDFSILHRSILSIRSKISHSRKRNVEKRRPNKVPQNDGDKTFRNTTLGSRFFNVINESCTTLVKTVANIFRKKNNADSFNEPRSTLTMDDPSCSFSFLKYMQKRDAVLKNKLLRKRNIDTSIFSRGTESCDTCDDTRILKKKMVKDEHLKQTIKKLKLGINLYGCDFKKISRTMWPRESYMTPQVLYNLYRKLLVK